MARARSRPMAKASRHRAAAPSLLRLALLVALAAFLTDWAAKSWALRHFQEAEVPMGSLVLGVERNDAFAFSSLAGRASPALVVGARLGVLLLLVILSRHAPVPTRQDAVGFALLLGGGFGNAADVALRGGAVIDFIGTGPFAVGWGGHAVHMALVFNTADVAILIGLGLLSTLIRDCALHLQRRLARWEAHRLGNR